MLVSFEDYVPQPRFDGLPWTTVKIEEGANKDGPWTLIDTQALAPLDADPKNPTTRNFTTDNAVLVEGWYRVSFVDANSNVIYTSPVHNVPSSDIDYKPTVGMVARKLLSRTKDQFGNELGDFTSATRPTDTQTIEIINDVVTEVADVIGDKVFDEFTDDAQEVVALRAAMQIELDFYADQVRTERSPYPLLKELYDEALLNLQKAIASDTEEDGVVDGSSVGAQPHYGFPDPMTTLTERM